MWLDWKLVISGGGSNHLCRRSFLRKHEDQVRRWSKYLQYVNIGNTVPNSKTIDYNAIMSSSYVLANTLIRTH